MEKRNFKDPAHIKWRKAVFARDKGRCQHPGCNSRQGINAHHIRQFSRYPELRTQVSNGITLCREHHKRTFGCEEAFEQLYTTIVQGKNKNPKVLRMRYTGEELNEK